MLSWTAPIVGLVQNGVTLDQQNTQMPDTGSSMIACSCSQTLADEFEVAVVAPAAVRKARREGLAASGSSTGGLLIRHFPFGMEPLTDPDLE